MCIRDSVSTDDLITMIKEGSNVPRKGHTQKRDVLADPMYNNKAVSYTHLDVYKRQV